MAKLRFPRLPVNWKDQPSLFERYWDISMTQIENLITTTEITPQFTGTGTTTVTGTYPLFQIHSEDQYDGTVTSVDISGGSTGLTFSGGPITASGSFSLDGVLTVANGGTGVTTETGTGSNVLSDSPVLTGTVTADSLITLGNLAADEGSTSMVDGFIYIPAAVGPPTSVPAGMPGRVPLYFDTSMDDLYVYNSGWKKITVA